MRPDGSVTVYGDKKADSQPSSDFVLDYEMNATKMSVQIPPQQKWKSFCINFGDGVELEIDESELSKGYSFAHQYPKTGKYLVEYIIEYKDVSISSYKKRRVIYAFDFND